MVLLSGCVKLTQLTANGSEVILWLRRSGNALGIFGIPAHGVYTCSAQVVTPVRALIWEWEKLSRTPRAAQIYSNIGHIVSEQLLELEERFREIATEKVSQRVVYAIARLLKHMGTASANGIEVTISREELAQFTGTTLFSISRLMTKWKEIGVIEPHRAGFVVRDAARLIRTGADD
jgi:CRP-like cAMP-binding protein